jgi:DNA-binding NtrC family response regulator
LELPLFEREYSDLSEARAGHKETVDLLVRGHLGLRTQQTPNYESTMTNKTKTAKPRGILLIVDYEDGPRESLGIIFKHEYDLLMARDGPTAIEHAKQHDIDVVVTEINMAGMSGIELLERLKLLKPDIEVIMMTGLETTDTFRESLRLGACDFINKPFDIATIRSAVCKAMQRRRLETK